MVLRLAEAPSPSAMRAIAVEISKPGLTARASREPDFERALRRLLYWVRCGEAHERLAALTVRFAFWIGSVAAKRTSD